MLVYQRVIEIYLKFHMENNEKHHSILNTSTSRGNDSNGSQCHRLRVATVAGGCFDFGAGV